jgi:hypothetical protein
MTCTVCGTDDDDLRFGVCYDCADRGEREAAHRTVIKHIYKAFINLRHRKWRYAWYDITWAWQRLTKTGDYAKGGYFDWAQSDWRKGFR